MNACMSWADCACMAHTIRDISGVSRECREWKFHFPFKEVWSCLSEIHLSAIWILVTMPIRFFIFVLAFSRSFQLPEQLDGALLRSTAVLDIVKSPASKYSIFPTFHFSTNWVRHATGLFERIGMRGQGFVPNIGCSADMCGPNFPCSLHAVLWFCGL